MYVEYTGLWVAGGQWLFTIAVTYWIWEDSQRHKKRAWSWLFFLTLGNPFGSYISNLYQYEVLPSRGVFQYLVPLFKYDSSQMAEPIWVLDILFFWGIISSTISTTITFMVIFWIYKDCQKSGLRATPWLFATRFIGVALFPINYFIPLGGYTGQVFILAGYLLRKHGYI